MCGFYGVARNKPSRIGAIKLNAIGIALVLLQLALNKLFGGDMHGVPILLVDVLAIKEVSFNFAIAVLGYIFICAGLIGLLKPQSASSDR